VMIHRAKKTAALGGNREVCAAAQFEARWPVRIEVDSPAPPQCKQFPALSVVIQASKTDADY